MSTHSLNQTNNHVGDDDRPRNRPRVGTLCVGVPKGGPPTTSTSMAVNEAIRPRKAAHVSDPEPPTFDGLASAQFDTGGQHRAPSGDTTRPTNALFEWFERERLALANKRVASPF